MKKNRLKIVGVLGTIAIMTITPKVFATDNLNLYNNDGHLVSPNLTTGTSGINQGTTTTTTNPVDPLGNMTGALNQTPVQQPQTPVEKPKPLVETPVQQKVETKKEDLPKAGEGDVYIMGVAGAGLVALMAVFNMLKNKYKDIR